MHFQKMRGEKVKNVFKPKLDSTAIIQNASKISGIYYITAPILRLANSIVLRVTPWKTNGLSKATKAIHFYKLSLYGRNKRFVPFWCHKFHLIIPNITGGRNDGRLELESVRKNCRTRTISKSSGQNMSITIFVLNTCK